MSSLVYSTNLDQSWAFYPQTGASDLRDASFFRTIPPERVGLNGEYDHSGLAKRVEQSFSKQFQPHQLEKLRITQRGSVVVLVGQVDSQHLLDQMVRNALLVMGAKYVETYGVRLIEVVGT